MAAGQPSPPPAAAPVVVAPAPPKCPEDGEGGACVWGKVEGFDGGSVQLRGLHVALVGVTAPARKDLCASKAAKEEFDCARPARKRMAEMVAKGVACEIVDAASGFLWGRCRNSDGDLGRQLIQAGLARAAKDGPYADAQKQAVQGKKGLWAADMILPRDWEAARRKAEDED
ncbi:thermonuclease family protein [Paramagnetospirillum marisnigri]|nr:thermonuclease family protein [Paramagnetospirillum marisnigri]